VRPPSGSLGQKVLFYGLNSRDFIFGIIDNYKSRELILSGQFKRSSDSLPKSKGQNIRNNMARNGSVSSY